ncbi:TetR/AcrR family transcriptional regulator [Ahrensia sp. R2A130]|uniref:TetR/AcrR family transcriptional regulator n=1 Tax=Ahrensia sp. R2A130 TaxID=744979 RepID=UPI0001E0F0AE|nr:TetR/AcrR family transcriptional regulator [Ahrensia sp. R2A130]EFL89155.1 TetR family transcriptional regulator [Ahrensia sp. R2A130]
MTSGDDERRKTIEAAAYAVLAEKGYRRTSMLSVAKAAKASNQTLYRWYGTKQGLFTALIERNADSVVADMPELNETITMHPMVAFGQHLLTMLTGDRAIALNRAAAADADETGELGPALAKSGRERVFPVMMDLLRTHLPNTEVGLEHAELFVALLVGDLQIRRATGAIPEVSRAMIYERANRAWRLMQAFSAES